MQITPWDVRAMLDAIVAADDGRQRPLHVRDRAVVLLHASGLDCATIASLRRSDVLTLGDADAPMQLRTPARTLRVPWSTPRELCAPRALWAWISRHDITDGPLLRQIRGKSQVQTQPLTSDAARQIIRRLFHASLKQTG